MDGTQHSAVAVLTTQVGDVRQQRLHIGLAQDGHAQRGGHRLHLAGDGGVLVGQVGVVAAHVHDAQGVTGSRKVHVHLLNDGISRIGKVDGDDVTHGGGHLIHQTAGLAEVHVLGVLGDLGDLHGADLALVVQVAQNDTDKYLESGRGRQAATLEHVGGGVGVEAADAVAQIGKASSGTANQRCGTILLTLHGEQLGDIHLDDGIALGLHTDAALGGTHHGDDVQIDRTGQHATVVVVGVVATDLGTTGSGEQEQVTLVTESRNKALDGGGIAITLSHHLCLAVQRGESGIVATATDLIQQDLSRHNVTSS